MRHAATLIVLVVLAVPTASLAAGKSDPGVAAGLARNAWYWQARAREDKAEEAWKQVLAADPDHAEALAALGGLEARSGRLEQARERLARLEKLSSGHPALPVLRREVELGPRYAAALAEARKLAHDGQADRSVARYRELFGPAGPPPDLALEYYATAGGTKAGWADAREGLTRLARRARAEPRHQLALARVLTYRDDTRRQGIAQLAALARNPAVARDAVRAWREALLWLPGTREDLQLLRAFAHQHPEDAAIAQRLQKDERSGALRSGFTALDEGDVASAEQRFEQAGDSPDARLGRALVLQQRATAAQRRGEHATAKDLLERARRLAPGRPDVWQEPLEATAFWLLLRDAREARGRGREDEARAKLLEALDRAPDGERWHAQLALAEVARAQRKLPEAEARCRDVLAAAPDQGDALRALAALLVEGGRFDEALPVNERLLRVAPDHAYRPEWLAAEDRRSRAARARQAGDLAAARSELEAARRADPSSAWVLHDLAGVLLEAGALPEAREATAALLRAAPALPETRAAEARLLATEGDKAGALQILGSLESSDAGLVALRRRLQVEVRAPALLQLAAEGPRGRAAASQELLALEREVAQDPALAATVALAWSKLGAPDRALSLMRAAVARAPAATHGARLQLASTLLEAGDEGRFTQLLEGLERDASLRPDERRWLTELRIAHAVRTADRARAQGNPSAATAALAPVLRDAPDDPRLLAALGRAEETSDPRRAHGAFTRALAAAPGDVEARRGAVDTVLALGDVEEARRLADEGVRRDGRDPRLQLLAGRAAARAGDDGEAVSALSRARDEIPQHAASPVAPSDRAALSADVGRELARIQARHRPAAAGAFEARERSGEKGLGAVRELRTTGSAEFPVRWRGRLTGRVADVALAAGAPSRSAASRLGTGGTATGALRARGLEIAAGYEERDLAVEVGSTPLGFPVQSLVGTLRLGHDFGRLSVGVDGGRRSVVESVVSYAGVTDPATRRTWGGVVAEGGRVDLSVAATDGVRLSLHAGADRLVGDHVAANRRALGGASARLRLLGGDRAELASGLNAFGLFYERNTNFYTFGHGGYFSPQRFLHAGVPVSFRAGRRVRFEAEVEPAIHAFEENGAPRFPLEGGPEAYRGSTTRGFALDARALLGFTLGSFDLDLRAAGQQAPEFRELRGMLVLRYGGPGPVSMGARRRGPGA